MFPACALLTKEFHCLAAGFESAFSDFEDLIALSELAEGVKIVPYNEIGAYAEFTDKKDIRIAAEFVQYIWCVCYGAIVIYDKGFKQPILDKEHSGKVRLNSDTLVGVLIFQLGEFIVRGGQPGESSLRILNSLCSIENREDYANKCTKVFGVAVGFVLLHELAHCFLGHNRCEPKKEHEFDADFYAFKKIYKDGADEETKRTVAVGVSLAIASICLLPDSMKGGDSHPDTDERIDRILTALCMADNDDIFCVIALLYKLWIFGETGKDVLVECVDNCKEFYDTMKNAVLIQKFY